MVREGYWSAGLVMAAALAGALVGWWLLAGAAALLACALGFFFRDPHRTPLDDPSLVLSPADGRVVEIGEADAEARALGYARRVAIFLSVLDVHVNRAPVAGTVERIEHRPGRFHAAFHPRASAENTSFTWWFRGPQGEVLMRQIAGVLARRIVAWKQPGEWVHAGERLGLIRLGSRVEVLFRDPVEWTIRVGDRVLGGLTPLARLVKPPTGAAGHER
ncbi:MAG: phosphatidylserine decarboxylase [Acidobacteriota bacterium]